MIKLFDAHCHLQDPRIFNRAPKLINTALENGILHFAVNGVSEKDWHLVKEMSDTYPSIIPSFGLHPWFIMDRTPNWLTCLREFFYTNPSAAVGEIGLDKGSRGKTIDFADQVETFRLQLQLAKEIKRPASVHCVRAFGDLLDIMKSIGPFPEGVILHSYLGSAEMVPEFAKLGAYFSFSGFLMAMKESKAKNMLKAVPRDRILLETDAPDALPKLNNMDSIFLVEEQDSISDKGMLNHPANIHFVLSHVASLLDLSKEEVADVSYRNAVGLFSYEGSKLQVIDGRKRILQSGSIHYPRATPEMWAGIIAKAKEGGLDVIETYVFWNYHEPVKGQYYFEGRFDLVKFVKTVHEAGLFVHLRIGPYACAEWNYGGFPLWLHFIPGIQFRTINRPYQAEMERFLGKIVNLMKEENLFASQGGPIILAQVENEYGNVEWAYGIGGELFVKWAAKTALSFNISVPWVMCSQSDAPDPIINTCNGFYCDTFTPNSPSKPKMWTEDYTGWFLSFGYPVPYRPVEDLAFAVARFFEKGGTFHNYYMYFGGTNFGRTAGGPLVATSYDYDAPLDEYGSIRQPKWGHLRDLHMAIKLCEEYLVNADPTHESLGIHLEADVYYRTPDDCAAFLANYGSSVDANVTFKGKSYFLPAWSVSILPDCKHVIFNTAKVAGQKSVSDSLSASVSQVSVSASRWSWYVEKVGVSSNDSFIATSLLEQINTTKDTSDFLWYTTSIQVDETKDAFLLIESLGHAALVFLNKKVLAFGYGYHDDASFNISEKIILEKGSNTLDIISMMIGVQNYGPWFDIMGAGLYSVILADLKNTKEDYSSNEWIYHVGTEGESLGLDKTDVANSSLWTHGTSLPINQSLIWYKSTFVAPEGNGPLSLNLASMGKGQAWINGQSIGRYWSTYLSPTTGCTNNCDYRGSYDAQKCQKKCGQPAQILYHIPRTWVKSGENLIVLHEELGGDPSKISVQTRIGQEVCSHVSEHDPIPVDLWKPDSDSGSSSSSQSPQVRLMCDHGWKIESIRFASFGNPSGVCGTFTQGTCHTDVLSIIQQVCIGKQKCWVPVSTAKLGNPCPGLTKSLAIEAFCSA